METYLKLPLHESSAYIISLYCTSLNLPTIQVVQDPILESKVINTAICKVQFSTAIFVEAPKNIAQAPAIHMVQRNPADWWSVIDPRNPLVFREANVTWSIYVNLLVVLQGSLDYQPKLCTVIFGKSPKITIDLHCLFP